MAPSCRVMVSSSASVSSSRARCATQRTSSADSAMRTPRGRRADRPRGRLAGGGNGSEGGRHLERPALLRAEDLAAADALDADAGALDVAADLDLHALEVGEEAALGGAGDLDADAAEVLGLAAV